MDSSGYMKNFDYFENKDLQTIFEEFQNNLKTMAGIYADEQNKLKKENEALKKEIEERKNEIVEVKREKKEIDDELAINVGCSRVVTEANRFLDQRRAVDVKLLEEYQHALEKFFDDQVEDKNVLKKHLDDVKKRCQRKIAELASDFHRNTGQPMDF